MKKLLVLVLAIVMCMSFAACGAKNADTPSAPSAPADAPSSAENDQVPSIPVLVGGALPFTNMENLVNENTPDGGYIYSDMNEDGTMFITNTAFSTFKEAGMSDEDYAAEAAASIADDATDIVVGFDEARSANLSYPAYVVVFTSGSNEDTKSCSALVTMTDDFTYVYEVSYYPDFVDGMDEIISDLFDGLSLEDIK